MKFEVVAPVVKPTADPVGSPSRSSSQSDAQSSTAAAPGVTSRRPAFWSHALVSQSGDPAWYRYHALLRSCLLAALSLRDVEAPARQHRATAVWLDTHGETPTALHHGSSMRRVGTISTRRAHRNCPSPRLAWWSSGPIRSLTTPGREARVPCPPREGSRQR